MKYLISTLVLLIVAVPCISYGKYLPSIELINIPIGESISSFNFPPKQQSLPMDGFSVFFVIADNKIAIADYNGLNQKLVKIFDNGQFTKALDVEPDGYEIVDSYISLSKKGVFVVVRSIAKENEISYITYDYNGNIINTFLQSGASIFSGKFLNNGDYIAKKDNGEYAKYTFDSVEIESYGNYIPPELDNNDVYYDYNIGAYIAKFSGKKYKFFCDYKIFRVDSPRIFILNENTFMVFDLIFSACGKYIGNVEIPNDIIFEPEEV